METIYRFFKSICELPTVYKFKWSELRTKDKFKDYADLIDFIRVYGKVKVLTVNQFKKVIESLGKSKQIKDLVGQIK